MDPARVAMSQFVPNFQKHERQPEKRKIFRGQEAVHRQLKFGKSTDDNPHRGQSGQSPHTHERTAEQPLHSRCSSPQKLVRVSERNLHEQRTHDAPAPFLMHDLFMLLEQATAIGERKNDNAQLIHLHDQLIEERFIGCIQMLLLHEGFKVLSERLFAIQSNK